MNDAQYQTWRLALHNKQIEIDNLEIAYWESVINPETGDVMHYDYQAITETYKQNRAALIEELEALYAATPPMP